MDTKLECELDVAGTVDMMDCGEGRDRWRRENDRKGQLAAVTAVQPRIPPGHEAK